MKNETDIENHQENVANVPETGITKPTKYTPELLHKLFGALEDGLNIKQTCRAVGIHENTLRLWRSKYAELEAEILAARERGRQQMLQIIKREAEKGDWRAAARHLELSYPADYRQSGMKVDINATAAGQHANIVCTPEQRQELIEQRERVLAGCKPENITPLQAPRTQCADTPRAQKTTSLAPLDDEP
jgi:transposase-like protein